MTSPPVPPVNPWGAEQSRDPQGARETRGWWARQSRVNRKLIVYGVLVVLLVIILPAAVRASRSVPAPARLADSLRSEVPALLGTSVEALSDGDNSYNGVTPTSVRVITQSSGVSGDPSINVVNAVYIYGLPGSARNQQGADALGDGAANVEDSLGAGAYDVEWCDQDNTVVVYPDQWRDQFQTAFTMPTDPC